MEVGEWGDQEPICHEFVRFVPEHQGVDWSVEEQYIVQN